MCDCSPSTTNTAIDTDAYGLSYAALDRTAKTEKYALSLSFEVPQHRSNFEINPNESSNQLCQEVNKV